MGALTILHLAANRWWTGSADPTLRLVAGLRDRGHRVLLGVVPGDRFEVKAREHGIVPVSGLDLRPRLSPHLLLRDVRRLRALVAAEGVEIVHAHHSHDHWLALAAAGARRGVARRIPVVRTFHRFRAVRRDRISRWLYRRSAGAFAVSRQIEARCREVGWPRERVAWIPGAADLGRFATDPDPGPIRAEFGLGADPVLVTVSRLAPHRGHELLLQGFRLVRIRRPGTRLLIVGKGENRPRLERLVQDLGLEGVIFTGYRDRDLPAMLAVADCFVLMAAGSDESCRAVLEAMAAGRPVVARRVGALPETVVHGETGLLVDDDRPEAVAGALDRILDDPAQARRMGAAGRIRAETEFSPARSVEIVERAYAALG